jgi:uncharacterized protein
MSDSSLGLRPEQRLVADRVLQQEERERRHIVVALSGAHAYGFPSPDSDLDLKAVHIERSERLLGLRTPPPTAERMELIEGVEIDYSSNELGPVLLGLLAGNGNFAERILGALLVRSSPELEELKLIATRALSRRMFRHYQGFATSQLREFERSPAPTAKRLLYVLRTTLTGTHLLETGELVPDLRRLIDQYGFGEARALIEAKRAGEKVTLDAALAAHWRSEMNRAFDRLERANEKSVLPETAPNFGEIEAWLIATRRADLGRN